MWWVILSIALAVLAIIAWAVMRNAKQHLAAHAADLARRQSETREGSQGSYTYEQQAPPRNYAAIKKWSTIALVSIIGGFGILTLASSCTIVSTKNVGIETSFGATAGHLGNGAHLIPPWYSVTEMDAAVQTDSYTTKDNSCLDVRIANQQTACVNISIRWRICASKAVQTYTGADGSQHKIVCDSNAADELFQDYRTFEHVRDSLVFRELTAAVNQQFSNYNPLNSVLGGVLPKGQQPNPPLTVIAARITSQMRSEIGKQIEVLNTIIPIVNFDPATQSRINQLQQQIALTRIAEQERVTNEKQALANKALAASVNTSPNVLVAQCLNTLEEMVKNNQAVPPGFSCWPGGSGIGVIANTTTTGKK